MAGLTLSPSERDLIRIVMAVRQLMEGRSNAVGQVTLAARELAPALLSANAQTWVNLHLLFTHGSGVVMSPVTQKLSLIHI